MSDYKRLARILEQQILEADQKSSEEGEQRERNHRYYAMQPIGNEMPGRSRYIDPSVMDVVESKKAFFRETFFSGRKTIKFLPTEGESQQQADAKTAYVERQLKLNDWYRTFRDCLHDAFVAKRCALHVEWLDDYDTTVLQLNNAHPQHIAWQMQSMQDVVQVDEAEIEQGPDGLLNGTLRIITDNSRVNLKLIAPERYYRDPHADYPENGAFVAYEEDVTRADLIEEGYDPEQVERLAQDYRFRREEEDNARRSHDGSWTRARFYSRAKETELITRYWSYAWLDLSEHLEGSPEEVRLYKICWVKNDILNYADGSPAIEEVSEMPFVEWSQYKISHAPNGMCDADIISPLQKQMSTFKRLIIDNQQMANTSRWQVQIGGVKNLRSLLDTSIGGVVETRSPDAVAPLPTPPLSPVTMSALEMLETDKESRSGNSRLSKGMNKDAMSEQNAASMIERLTNSANKRIAGEARDFAETFIVPLMRMIYRIGVRSDKRAYQLEASGQQMSASPQQWSEPAPQADVAVALTPEEGVKRAMSLMQMHQLMSMDPSLGMLYGVKEKHALVDEMFELLGVDDASRFMMRPDSDEFAQQMQMQQQQMEEQKQIALQQQMAQMQLMQSADQREWQRFNLDREKAQMDMLNIASDNSREDEKLDHDKVVDFMKIDVEKKKAGSNG